MDALTVLGAVAKAYGDLTTLAVEMLITNESKDDDGSHRSEHRGKAFYVEPDKVRIEEGERGLTVTNGVDLHQYFRRARRYMKSGANARDVLPGRFRPEYPVGGGLTFLFNRIAERVVKAEFLRDEGHCHVLSVEYEPPPYAALTVSSPLMFWVDSRTNLIARLEGEVTHRHPAQDETVTNKVTAAFTRTSVNETIPLEMFEFAPPADAVDLSRPRGEGGFIAGGGGGGTAGRHGETAFEIRDSHDWVGDTMVLQSKLRLGSVRVTFERRLTLSADGSELRFVERIIGPKEQTEREITIPVV